jgi:hypothetical protein
LTLLPTEPPAEYSKWLLLTPNMVVGRKSQAPKKGLRNASSGFSSNLISFLRSVNSFKVKSLQCGYSYLVPFKGIGYSGQ